MNVEYEIPSDMSGIKMTIAPDDDVDALLLKQFDSATPTFHLEDNGALTAVLTVTK